MMVPKQRIIIVGCGRLARLLAQCLLERQPHRYCVTHLHSRSLASAKRMQQVLGQGEVHEAWQDLPLAEADWLWLALPDAAIRNVCQDLIQKQQHPRLHRPRVLHFSGALGVSELHAACAEGYEVGSIHPAFSFSSESSSEAFAGTMCSYQYMGHSAGPWEDKIRDLGGIPCLIRDEQKIAYHAALCMSSNFLVALLDVSYKLLQQAGLPPELGLRLAEQTLANIRASSTQAALTGPIQRGDAATVAQHLQVLDGDTHRVYQALGLWVLQRMGEGLEPTQQKVLRQLLEDVVAEGAPPLIPV